MERGISKHAAMGAAGVGVLGLLGLTIAALVALLQQPGQIGPFAVGALIGAGLAGGYAFATASAFASLGGRGGADGEAAPKVVVRASADADYLQGHEPPAAEIGGARPVTVERMESGASGTWRLAREKVQAKFTKRHPQGFGVELIRLSSISIDCAFVFPVPHLSAFRADAGAQNLMGMGAISQTDSARDQGHVQRYNQLISRDDIVLYDIIRKPGDDTITTAFLRAGPRKTLHFEPNKVRAAIVTCGGLCPGLNNIIQGIVNSLDHLYGCRSVLGVRGGYQGFGDPDYPPMPLSREAVEGLQNKGGTVLGSGRGSFDADKTLAFLQKHKINQLYVVGGDGTHRAANDIAKEARARQLDLAVCGVPKTIDNDIDLLDRSFGFNTAVEEAQKAIRSAQTEAVCNLPNGIGIVKLMGRHSGFIAVHATLCSGEVDLCLIPEVPVVTDGDKGCLPHLERVLAAKGHAVVVVAEGAGEEILGQSAETDAGGNRRLPELGKWLKDQIGVYFKKRGKPVTVKYIDPSYMIRSVPANASDAIYCLLLAQNAVHGAMVRGAHAAPVRKGRSACARGGVAVCVRVCRARASSLAGGARG
jgi:6-phosphofructokinase 1